MHFDPGAWLATRMVALADNCRIGRGPNGNSAAQALQARTLASNAGKCFRFAFPSRHPHFPSGHPFAPIE